MARVRKLDIVRTVQLLEYIGRNPFSKAKDLKDIVSISLSYMEQFASQLTSAGLIRAKQGKLGGYYLLKDPRTVTMYDIQIACDPKMTLEEHAFYMTMFKDKTLAEYITRSNKNGVKVYCPSLKLSIVL